jgi:hypothetical protein
MALSDLAQVSARLKALHKELERKEGRRWTYYDLSEATGIPHRTWQSWEGGEVENRDGKGYEKMARFYTKKLGREVTKAWILFGREGASAPAPNTSVPMASDPTNGDLDRRLIQIEAAVQRAELTARQNQEKLDQILDWLIRREAELIEEGVVPPEQDEAQEPEQDQESGGEAAP